MAAVSAVTVSVGTGTVAAGSAFLLISSSSVVEAALKGPRDAQGNYLTYKDYVYDVLLGDVLNGRNWMSFPIAGDVNEDGSPVTNINLHLTADDMMMDPDQAPNEPLGIKTAVGTNLKITLDGLQDSENIYLSANTDILSTTLWVTGNRNSLIIGQAGLTQSIQDIYVENVALQIAGSYQGPNELRTNFHISSSSYVGSGPADSLNGSALVFGSVEDGNTIYVSTTGGLEVDAVGAKIGFNNASQFTVRGALTGSGHLSLASEEGAAGRLYLLGGSKDFTGSINFGQSYGTELFLGSDISLGGLQGGARNVVFGTSGVGSVTLTLNVKEGFDYRLTSTRSDASGSAASAASWASGIFVQKTGMGSQLLYNFSGSGVGVSTGHLVLGGSSITIGSRGVNVKGGTLTFVGSGSNGLISFSSGSVNVENGTIEMVDSFPDVSADTPHANMRDVTLNVNSRGSFSTVGNVELGYVNLKGGSISLTGVTDLGYASMIVNSETKQTRLNFQSGSLRLGGRINNLQNVIELGSGMNVTIESGLLVDLSSLDAGYTEADLGKHTFSYVVDVLHAAKGATVDGWVKGAVTFIDRDGSETEYEVLHPSDTAYSAGVSWDNAVIVQDLSTTKINWRNARNVEGLQTWADGTSSLALRVKPDDISSGTHSVTFITGEDNTNLTSGPLTDGAYYQRRAAQIYVDNNTEMILRRAVNTYVQGTSTITQYLGNVAWEHMLLMGTLTLKDKEVIAAPQGSFDNTVDSGPNALVVIDWRSDGTGQVTAYDSNSRFIGNSSNLPTGYTGKLEVRSGIFEVRNSDNFSEIVVKSGGQLSLRNFQNGSIFMGNVTLSGSGLVNVPVSNQNTGYVKNAESDISALKFINNAHIAGTVTIADAAAIHSWINETGYIDGALVGVGLGQFTFTRAENTASHNWAHLVVNGQVRGIKLFDVREYSDITINSDFSAASIDEATVASQRFNHMSGSGLLRFTRGFTGFNRITISGNGTLELAGEADALGIEPSFGADVANFTKDGVGSMYIYRHLDVSDTITIAGGDLRFGNSATDAYRLGAREVFVNSSAEFIISHRAESFNAAITLSDGILVNGQGWVRNGDGSIQGAVWRTEDGDPAYHFRALTLLGSNSELNWAGRDNEGFVFDLLTGNGDLRVGTMGNAPLMTQVLEFDEIVNYSGTVHVAVTNINNLAGTKKVSIGTVHQDRGWNGAISITGGSVLSSHFRKTGEGSFSITSLSVRDEVWMNYEGTLTVNSVKFANETVLHYTATDNDHVLLSQGVESDNLVERLYIDVLSISAEQLNRGINLGFYSNVENSIALFEEKLVIGGLNKGDYTLYTQDGRLYLRADKPIDQTWDRAMGVKSLAFAPTSDQMEQNGTYGWSDNTKFNWGDKDSMLQLGASRSDGRYAGSKNNQSITYAKLTNNSGGAYFSVLGGACYDGGVPISLDAQSYIYLVGGTYRMLIGGSSNSNDAAGAETGFFGGSHIQIESGSVDYVVGGNHLSSGAFRFEGDSYVSVRGGSIKGGIVGGNTYAGGGGAFTGDSHIFIYTALANAAKTPTIGLPLAFEDTAAPFTSVVGGSAYVSDGTKRSAITFTGDSEIVIDLSKYSGSSAFGKSIVGGNAYYAQKTWKDDSFISDWDSTFRGDSSITITGNKTTFQDVVVGASHHDIAGGQSVVFEGDTHVNIASGIFKEAVVGGSYHGAASTGSYASLITGDTHVDITGGTFWRVTGGSYVLSAGQSATTLASDGSLYMSVQEGDSSVTISGGTFNHTSQQSAAGSKAAAGSYRSFVAGGRYFAGNRGDDSAHLLIGTSKLTVTGGSFTGTVLAGGDFFSATVPSGMGRYPNPSSIIDFGSYADISGATITNGVAVGGSFLTDTAQGGSITVRSGSHLVIGQGATITSSSSGSLDGIAAVGGNYLDVAGIGHSATTEDGSSVTVSGKATITGHIVGGSVLTGHANSLSTSKIVQTTSENGIVQTEVKGATSVTLSGGTVKGNVYGGHYVGSAGSDPRSSAITSVGDVFVTLDGASVTGNIYGGGYFACGFGYGSDEYVQSQGAVTVSLLKGSLSGDVYAAGSLGRPAEIKQSGADSMQPEGAHVYTDSTRVEIGSALSFGKSSTTVSGDYQLTDSKFADYHNEPITGGRTLAFVDAGNYSKMKNWSGVTFRDFDAIEVAAEGDITLSAKQFTGESTGFTKLGEGRLTLGAALSSAGQVAVHGGTLVLEKKQNLSGGLHFDLTGRSSNDASSAFLQANAGYAAGTVDVFLDMTAAEMDSIGFGHYYLASNWDASSMSFIEQWVNDSNSTREFRLMVENNCLVLHVRENSNNLWLWRGDTKHPVVGAYQWDSQYSANWNAHEKYPDNNSLNPEGKDVLFTASVGGEVLVGELVHPSTVTVASGNYVFRQRSPEDNEGIEGIWTDRLIVGGATQEAVLDLALANRNINNVFLETNGTLILSDENAITSSIPRPEYNSIIYFNGGRLVYGENFSKDISWQISSQGTGRIQVDVAANHVEPDEKGQGGDGVISWGKMFDSENANTWSSNNGLLQTFSEGIDKGGEGTLRFIWGSNHSHYSNTNDYSATAFKLTKAESQEELKESIVFGDINVTAGKLEFLMNGTQNYSTFRNVGSINVEEGAEVVYSVQRGGVVFIENTISGSGSIVLGRQLSEASTYRNTGVIRCRVIGHGGDYMPVDAGATYVLAGNNGDFFGSIVLEGDGSREARNYVQLGQRYTDDRYEVSGFERSLSGDRDTGDMVCLGGGKTTLVLAGRHLTTTGMISYMDHPEYNRPIGYEYGDAVVDWRMFGNKYVRSGTVEVREDTITYIGSSCQDSETDNARLAASSYRHWDNNFIFTGKLVGSGTIAIPWGYAKTGACGGYYPGYYANLGLEDIYEDRLLLLPAKYRNLSGVGGDYSHQWWGPVSEFTGTIVAGDLQSRRDGRETSGASWTFSASSASAVAGERSIINATLAGCGTMIFDYTQDTTLAAPVGNATNGALLNLTNIGGGKIILGSNKNISTGLLYLKSEAGMDLGDADHYANWAGTAIRGGENTFFTLVNGELASAMQPVEGSGVRIRVETSPLVGTRVNAGGTLGTDLYEVIINKDGYLSGVWENITASRDHTRVRLVFSKNNVGSAGDGQHMIEMRYNRSLIVEDADYFVLDFGVDSIVDLLKEEASAPQAERYLHVLSKGTLDIAEGMWDDLLADGGDGARLLSQLGLYIERIEGGDIVMKAIGGKRAYYVFKEAAASDSHTVNQYDILSGYEAVIIEAGQTLNINLMGDPEFGTRDYLAGGAVVPNLWGDRNSRVNVTNTNPNRGRIRIIFENSAPYDKDSSDPHYQDALDSVFYGTIYGGDSVDFVKDGAGTMIIGYHDKWGTSGGFYGDNFELRKGGLYLQGTENEVRDTLTFNYSSENEENGVTFLYGASTVGKIVEKSSHASFITMGGNATLTLTDEGTSNWGSIFIRRENDQSTGSLILEAGSINLTNSEKVQLQGVHLNLLGESQLSLNCMEGASVASLGGSGTLTANVGGTLQVTNEQDATFTGTLVGTEGAENTLHLKAGAGTMTMRNVSNEQRWNLYNGGKLILDVSGKESPSTASNSMSFGAITLGDKSTTTYYINPDHIGDDGALTELITAKSFNAADDVESALFVVESKGDYKLFKGNSSGGKDTLIIAKFDDPEASSADLLSAEIYGFAFLLHEAKGKDSLFVDANGNLCLQLTKRKKEANVFAHDNQEANAAAGAKLFWDALWEPSRLYSLSGDEGHDLREMLVGIDKLAKQGNYEALDKALAGGAGASVSTLGPALAQDLQRQLRAIRNRTTTMGANQSYVAGEGPAYHMWMNAEGNYHKMEADSLAPGFTLSSWGGTVGMDADVSSRSTVGLAISAMYGNLDTEAADKGDGKIDTYYLNFFAKTARGRWMHTVVGSLGLANVSLDRTVDYGGDSACKTSGSTNGYAFGLMYEVGYSIPMNSEASYALQPIANVTLRHVGISGYEESGNGAQLRVGDITQTIFTLGAGVRAQAVVGENVYNRTSVLEGRLIAKVDVGDNKGKADNALVYGSTTTTVPVESAELGAVGLEVGVGITVPMDNSKGSIFVDASAELRAGYTNLNATVGYRIDF